MEVLWIVVALLILALVLSSASRYTVNVNSQVLQANGYTIGTGSIHNAIGSKFTTGSSNLCEKSCASNASCSFWQWSQVDTSCQLFSTSDVDKTSVETGFKTSPGQPDYKYGSVPTAQACMDSCTKDTNCLGWVHYNQNASEELRGTCSLIAAKANGYKDFQGFKI